MKGENKMAFVKELITHDVIDFIKSTFKRLGSSLGDFSLRRISLNLDFSIKDSYWIINRETGDFLLCLSDTVQGKDKNHIYCYYHNNKLFNLAIIDDGENGGILERLNYSLLKEENPDQEFKDSLVDAFIALERHGIWRGKLSFKIEEIPICEVVAASEEENKNQKLIDLKFKKEPITDEAIDIITSTFERLENKHINGLRSRRTDALDKECGSGWAVNRETGDFLIAGAGIPQTLIRYYYYYYNGQIFNLLIRSVYYGGVLEKINLIEFKKLGSISQDFKDNLVDAFMALEKDGVWGGKLTFGVEQ